MKKIIFLLLFIFMKVASAETTDAYPFASDTDADRFASLTQSIRCVVCQNQTIADSSAPLANDLRQKIYVMILHHESDADIKNYLVKRYGEFILLQPRLSKTTFLLWSFPVIAIGSALFFLMYNSK